MLGPGRHNSVASQQQHGGMQAATAAAMPCRGHRCVRCAAGQQLIRPPERPGGLSGEGHAVGPTQQQQQQPKLWPAQQQAAYQQAAQQPLHPTQRPQHMAQQLLSRPSHIRPANSQQAAPQSRRRQMLDDADTAMAAFDQLEVQVACKAPLQPPPVASSFNTGPVKVRPALSGTLKALRIHRPTPLQAQLLLAIKSSRDVLAAGPPGAGTSTAALLGVLQAVLSVQRIMPRNKAMPLALVLCPNRELAMQLGAQGAALVKGTQLKVKAVTGGLPVAQQVLELRHGADLLVATPGRLMELLAKKTVSLARLKYLVMEDVEELMGPVLLPVSRQVLHHHSMPGHTQRHTIALGSSALPQQQLLAAAADVLQPSATVIRSGWPVPAQQQQQQQEAQGQQQQLHQQGGQAQLAGLLANPAAALAASAAAAASAIPPTVSQRFLGVAPQLKMRFLLRLLAGAGAAGGGGLVLVFTNSHAAADEVGRELGAAGVSAGVLHAARSQAQRDEALQCFRYGVTQVLVACGIAYRGIDLPDVAQVVNYDVPLSLAEYARRLGRAGRAGRAGAGTTLVTPADGATVGPLVAVLRAGGQAVPDWLLALTEGGNTDAKSSSSSSSSSRDSSLDNAGSGSSCDSSGAAVGAQVQAESGSEAAGFRMKKRKQRIKFGAYMGDASRRGEPGQQ